MPRNMKDMEQIGGERDGEGGGWGADEVGEARTILNLRASR